MFKKFKDKLAEEVKSSPQRLHQFAQAAQAAVTSASSSISDITNNDLFSIGDNDSINKSQITQHSPANVYSGPSPIKSETMNVNLETTDLQVNENQRLRRLSNSSFSSDISFRLPSYESPSMYHLQSDMEVSASEAEEKSPFGGMVNLDRVSKEQLYAAYRRTQDRCKKYKSQYSDLARHYKLLERENAKARNVLVETQDKALRRISELREQCSLEQSAKAHLEQVLRTEIEEKNMKIESLHTKLNLLQIANVSQKTNDKQDILSDQQKQNIDSEHLIDFESSKESPRSLNNEVTVLNHKMEKMEQLVNKYKESLKLSKEKNAHLNIEINKFATELENKSKENDSLKTVADSLNEAKNKINELNENIETLQNENNTLEFLRNKEVSILDMKLKSAEDEILNYKSKVEVLSKREEEYAISLAENKLCIHKELESKEAEIKTLKISLSSSQSEIKNLETKITELTTSIDGIEKEKAVLKDSLNELELSKAKIAEYQIQLEVLTEKCKSLENSNNKVEEEYKCLQLQLKQEAAEKLAMIDRNVYLENRNEQLVEENVKKNNKIKELENDLQNMIDAHKDDHPKKSTENSEEIKKINEELLLWKNKCTNLESEIHDEKIELEKLQAEIEKLLHNYHHVQKQNQEMNITFEDLRKQNNLLQSKMKDTEKLKSNYGEIKSKFVDLRHLLNYTSQDIKSLKSTSSDGMRVFNEQIIFLSRLLKKTQDSNVNEVENLQSKAKCLENELHEKSQQYKIVVEELKRVKEEHQNLISNIEQMRHDDRKSREELEIIKTQHSVTNSKLIKMREESRKMEDTIKKVHEDKLVMSEEISVTKKNNCELLNKIDDMEREKISLNDDLNKKMVQIKDTEDRLSSISKSYDELLKIKQDSDEKAIHIRSLEKEIENLKVENSLLQISSDKISKSLDDIETEMKELKLSHLNIEKEKDHLNSIIEKLEENSNRSVEDKEVQSEFEENIESTESLKYEIESLLQVKEELTAKLLEKEKIPVYHEDANSEQYDDLTNNCELLKNENKRLQSDIEGLQIYMTKVSKENDELNNKIRELISSSENITGKIVVANADTSIQERIESLLRENSLLVEENFELKDQIQLQTSKRHDDILNRNSEKTGSKNNEEYEKLAESKSELENRLKDLEEMNYTVNSDMLVMKENNKKLKLSNEKLERKLDEALVSLRHLHSLQENTELEYLKNILFEYLTGSGTHSYTLAKVLSAVVKFDDTQTDIVLQKEKERQGVLRQLGII